MNVAVAEEPQKKVFRARKTMKISDRQQLEFLHSSLSSSSSNATTSNSPLVNGNHMGEDHTDSEKEAQSPTDSGQKVKSATFSASRSPSPLSLSLSLSPSPPCPPPEMRTPTPPTSSPPQSLNVKEKEEVIKGSSAAYESGRKSEEQIEKGEQNKDGTTNLLVDDIKDSHPKSAKTSPSQSPHVGPTASTLGPQEEETKKILSAEAMKTDSLEDDKTALNTSSPFSPSHAPESDQEVKEGFLVLSEEDDNQGDKDEEKDTSITGKAENMEMEVDIKRDVGQEGDFTASFFPSPPSSTQASSGEEGTTVTKRVKRALSKDSEMDELREVGKRGEKRPKVEGEEFEAQLELKISADAGHRFKLEKVVQQLVEEQLRVLQLSVFDRSLQELRERVEKLDCATKHQQTLNTLQAKIARLAKKFGAANQAKENVRKPAEVASSAVTPTTTTPLLRSAVRTTAEPKQTTQNQSANAVNSKVSSVQSQSPSRTSPPVSAAPLPAPLQSLGTPSTPSGCVLSSSGTVTLTSQSQSGTVMLKPAPVSSTVPPAAPLSASQAVPLQPLVIQLPLAVASPQGGAVVTSHGASVDLLPVTSLPTSNGISKVKTTTPATPLILQKSSALSSVPPPLPAQTPSLVAARAVQPGTSGNTGTPTSGGSNSSVRVPTQGISAVGVSSATSLPVASGPAATGGQSAGSAASGPMMASKTADNQPPTSSAKTPVQATLTSGSGAVIDLTEDDDDVQVTGVKKAPVPSGLTTTASTSSSSFSSPQRPLGAPPPLISTTSAIGTALRSSPQISSHSVNGPQAAVLQRPSQARPANASSSAVPSPVTSSSAQPCPLPPLPSPPPPPARLPPEATHTSAPQQPQLKLARVQSQNGIVLSWCVAETDRTCAAVDSYHLYAYHQDHSGLAGVGTVPSQWKKIGEVKALPLPMACTLTQFVSGSTYYFAVRARDVYGRFGPFCEPQCTDVISSSTSS